MDTAGNAIAGESTGDPAKSHARRPASSGRRAMGSLRDTPRGTASAVTRESEPQPQSTTPRNLLTTGEVADQLSISVRTVKNLLCSGRIAYVKIGRATRIKQSDVDEYVQQNRRKERRALRVGESPAGGTKLLDARSRHVF